MMRVMREMNIHKRSSVFLKSSCFGSLSSPVSWDRQALSATQRKERDKKSRRVASQNDCDSGGIGRGC
jgi:hypothetical protein